MASKEYLDRKTGNYGEEFELESEKMRKARIIDRYLWGKR